MIDFSPEGIYNRAADSLKQNPDWRPILNNSVVSAILKSNSEILAETARYAEYLFKESRWDAAQNVSSILSMANMLGYQPKRKISARGSIYVSVDPRILNVGRNISSYDFENLVKYTTSTPVEDRKTSLIFNTPSNDITITSNWIIKNNNSGVQYIAPTKSFHKESYATSLEIVQGIKKSIYIPISTIRKIATTSKLDPYVYIPVEIEDCENASNIISKKYLKISTMKSKTETLRMWRIVDTLLFSDSTDYDVEVYNDMYSQNLFYLKFNNDLSRGPTLDLTENSTIKFIKIDYLESLGEGGNLLDVFESFTLTSPYSSDPKLYGINLAAINAGENEEKIFSIKKNAPKFYINNYTAGTKEAYENTILNLDIAVDDVVLRPTNVRVYGGSTVDTNGNTIPLTCISFIAKGLEDLVTSSVTNPYTSIEDSLNFYLSRLKSPQDTLKFIAPNYVPFALGIKCRVSKNEAENLVELVSDIQNLVEKSWGPNSDELDFERNFYPSSIVSSILQNFSEVKSVNLEVEALTRLNWNDAERISPWPTSTDSDKDVSTIMHTFRTPFSFNSLFLGAKPSRGFKDYRTGASYVMRIDFLYKKPRALASLSNNHISLFIKEDLSRTVNPFYVIQDSNNYWEYLKGQIGGKAAGESNSAISSTYDAFSIIPAKLENTYQFYLKEQVYEDSDFNELTDSSSTNYTATLKTEENALGTLSDYLIYFSANYDKGADSIGAGWIELPFVSLYNVLLYFSSYDINLRRKLEEAPLSLLQCGTNSSTQFSTFISILNEYVEAYVCMRPIDPDLSISLSNASTDAGSSVLYIDSYDGASTSKNKSNLTSVKKARMISVNCTWTEE